jgi:hypothetical protein
MHAIDKGIKIAELKKKQIFNKKKSELEVAAEKTISSTGTTRRIKI